MFALSGNATRRDSNIGIPPEEIIHSTCVPEVNQIVPSYVKSWMIIAGLFIIMCCTSIYTIFLFNTSLDRHCRENGLILSRQTRTLTDWGYSDRFRGWVDVQGQEVANDYARYVGPNNEYPFVWLSIALAGSTEQYTDIGLYEECNGIVSLKPRQKLIETDKLGLPGRFRGWVDVQNQGFANDYAYYVAPTIDNPYTWLTVALAGSKQRRTPMGLYEERFGVVRKTQVKQVSGQTTGINSRYYRLIQTPSISISENNKTSYLKQIDEYPVYKNLLKKKEECFDQRQCFRNVESGEIKTSATA
ncbi:unnamed protein product [Rotaria socialis]